MAKVKTHYEDCDILVVGGGMAGTGATFEARHWGRDLKIVCVEKANIDRSGAVAQGLYAINCYMGMQWDENQPEDHVRYARNDLMGLVREDLGYDMARHVDSAVHMFEEWGLPMMKDEKTGRYLREGKWQIMIHGESYKPIVAEAAKKSAAARSDLPIFKAMENIVQFETPVEIEEEKDLGLVSLVEDFTGVEKEEIPPIEKKQVTEYKSYKMGVRVILGNTSGKASTTNSSLSLILENYGLGFNQMSFKTTSSKNNVYEMKNSSLDLSYTLELTSTIVEDWSATAGLGYVYGGKGSITSAESAIKYETESVSGFGLFGLLGMVWEGLEGLIGVRYYNTNYTDFKSTNTSEVLSLGKPYVISDAQLVFGLGYSFLW